MQRLASLLLLGLLACAHGVAGQKVLRVGRYTATGGPVKAYEDGILSRLAKTAKYTITEVPLATFEERLTKLEDGSVDMVIAQFTVTDARKERITFITPYYFGDGASLFVKNSKFATYNALLQSSDDPAVAYANFDGKSFCNEAGIAYIPSAQSLGMVVRIVASQAAMNRNRLCDLTTSDSTGTIQGWTRLVGPLLPDSAIAMGLGVPLKTGALGNKAVRLALESASIALYTGVPGSTPIEKQNKASLESEDLTGASAPIANGAKFMNNFYT